MGSKPRTSDVDAEILARVSDGAGAADGPTLGRVITERMRPRLGLSRRSLRHARPGQLVRASQTFGMTLGLSHQNRRQYAVNTELTQAGVSSSAIRPPIDYWPWREDTASADQTRAAARAAIVNRVVAPEPPKSKADRRVEALKRMLMGPPEGTTVASAAGASPASVTTGTTLSSTNAEAGAAVGAPVQRVVRRGLPLTPRRHGRTWAGAQTSPGGMANGAAPQSTNSVAPSRFGGGAPEPLPSVAHTGVSDSDRSAPATGVQSAPSREARLREMLQRQGALPSDRTSAPTVSADRLVEKYAPPQGRGPQAPQRPAQPPASSPSPANSPSSEARARSANVLGRTLAPEVRAADGSTAPAPARFDSVARVAPSSGRVSAEVLRTMSPARHEHPTPGPEGRGLEPGSGPAPHATIRPTSIATSSLSSPSGSPLPVSLPLTQALAGVARSGVLARESNDLLVGASVQPPWRSNPDDGGSTSGVATAPAADRRDATTTLTRADRHRVEPLQRTLLATASRPTAGWGPRHRHGLIRSADGQSVQWTESADAAEPLAVLGGVALRASSPILTPAQVSLLDPNPAVAPPMHRSIGQEPVDKTPAPATDARADRSKAGTILDRSDGTRSASQQRLSQEWFTTERLVDVDRLPAPSRGAPPRALENGLQRVLAGSSDMAAGLGELTVAPPVARDGARVAEPQPTSTPGTSNPSHPAAVVGPVPVTAAVMAEALRAVTEKSKPKQSPDMRRAHRSSITAAEPAVGTAVAAETANGRAPASARSSVTGTLAPEPNVPARPGAMFSKLAGVSLLGRRPLAEVAQPGPVADQLRAVRDLAASNGIDTMPNRVARASDAAAAQLPAHDLAERFLTELARHRQERPKPLPTQFASIADLIVGKRRPLVSTSEASQRALAAVDKVAATTGDVIHLAAPNALARPNAELTGIIAHELTHVAAPSPAPRFFADERHTAEERRANEIGDLMRRSPAPPPSGSIASPGRTAPMTITEQHTRSARTGTVTSSTSSGATSGTTSGSRADTIRRAMASVGSTGSSASPSIQRAVLEAPSTTSSESSSTGGSYESGSAAPMTSDQFSRLLREHFDLIVELLEDRIGSDIERRGGRYRGGY